MENNKPVKDPYRSALKKKAMVFMPKNYEDVHAQRQILAMIVAVVPAAAGIVKAAEANLWPKVQNKSLPIVQAVGQCALEVNKAIAAAPLESLLLEKRSNETLLKAWVALDYYSYLMLPEYSANIRALRDRMFAILRQRDTGAAPAARPMAGGAPVPGKPAPAAQPVRPPVTPPAAPPVVPAPQPPMPPMGQAEDLNKTVMVERAPEPAAQAQDPGKTVMAQPDAPAAQDSTTFAAAAEEISATVSVVYEEAPQAQPDQGKKKSVAKAPIAIIAAVAVVAAVVIGIVSMGGKAVDKAEEAIAAIGTVTLESADEIETAEALYEDLSEGNQAKVENREILFAARAEYDRQAAAVAEVETAIDAIGAPVNLNSGDAVKKARKLYDALEAQLQAAVTNYSELKTKEQEYTKLYNEDRAAFLYAAAEKDYEAGNCDAAIEKLSELLNKHAGTSLDAKAKALGANCVVISAQAAMNENRLEDAMRLLNKAEKDYVSTAETKDLREKLANRLNAARPANGKMFRVTSGQGYCEISITAKSSDICIKLISKDDPEKYAKYYIREDQTFNIFLKPGTYIMHYAYGDYWYGEEAMFGEDGNYKWMPVEFELITYSSGSSVTARGYEFTLDVSTASAEVITREEF